ncbi:GHKL domain-containing protein [Bacillus mangrovi]|uniref:histidine kinase n=1 Tax=Metabacillus mangrovi TaxID=1491830 RepID=A0A7X2S9K5_9BACI|nr:sensor histidine kinase [Metabacillus mangrovi]MTH55690.1 GHKL domain-containing protein [Metabacillus mangrovi]
MRKTYSFTLQTKIAGLVIIILLIVIGLFIGVFTILESADRKKETEKLAVQTAASAANLPEMRTTLAEGNEREIQGLAERIRDQVEAASIIVTDRDSRIFSHPDPDQIGKTLYDQDSDMALIYAGRYSAEGKGTSGESIKGKAPILIDGRNYQEVAGVVTVEFSKSEMNANIAGKIASLVLYTLPVLAAGIIGSVLLARNIRKDTLGLEPNEIAALYRDREAILSSLSEGIIALDQKGRVTMMNPAAEQFFRSDREGDQDFLTILDEKRGRNFEISYHNRILIVDFVEVIVKGHREGTVWTIKDKTELVKLIDTLSEVKRYSEDLRAQTHEYTNKLYVLSGLLELGNYSSALALIREESVRNESQNAILFQQIKDENLQAILLGKIGRASEKKIQFTIDLESSAGKLPEHLKMSALITIAGNLIDNAFEAVSDQLNKEVSFFITDLGEDVIIEVEDNGPGIPQDQEIFKKGASTKGDDRGYGLYNVRAAVEELGGLIEAGGLNGAVFTVSIPKKGRLHSCTKQ